MKQAKICLNNHVCDNLSLVLQTFELLELSLQRRNKQPRCQNIEAN